jgi:ABC-type bacteriocin/lantibiotic exporter with double-glycine peptidase domain
MSSETKDAELLTKAEKGLGSLLGKSSSGASLLAPSGLEGALALIGKSQGISFSFQVAPFSDDTIEKRIDRICRMSEVNYRMIALAPLLGSSCPFPLLGFMGEKREPVVLKVTEKGCYYCDPDTEEMRTALIESLDSQAYQFYGKLPTNKSFSYLAILKNLLIRYSGETQLALIAGLLMTLTALLFPFAIKQLFDRVIHTGSLSFLAEIFLGLSAVMLSSTVFGVIERYTISRLRTLTLHDLEMSLWGAVFRSSTKLVRKFTAGEIFQKIEYFSRNQNLLGEQAITALLNVIFAVGYLGVMFFFSPAFALCAIGVVVVTLLIAILPIIRYLAFQREFLPLNNRLVSLVIQYIRGIRTIRITRSQTRFFASWAKSFIPTQDLMRRSGVIKTAFASLMQFSPYLITFLVYGIAVMQMEADTKRQAAFTTGDYLAFVYALNSFVQASFAAFNYFFEVLGVAPSWNQAKDVISLPPESTYVSPAFIPLKGDIDIENVHFSYEPDKPVLKEVNLSIKAGEFIGIVGRTGSGKSTLFRLLLGMEEPSKGVIRIDGRDLKERDLLDYRSQVGCILQNSLVFEGSLLENIALGRKVDEAKIQEVLKASELASFVAELPMGIHTHLSYAGNNISLGQKQRVLIARGLINNPKILFFDEATSAQDNLTQKRIMENLEAMRITRVVIAHRRSTLANADRIFSLENGRLELTP